MAITGSGIKCQKCRKRFGVLYRWFGFSLCTPCIEETVDSMTKAGLNASRSGIHAASVS